MVGSAGKLSMSTLSDELENIRRRFKRPSMNRQPRATTTAACTTVRVWRNMRVLRVTMSFDRQMHVNQKSLGHGTLKARRTVDERGCSRFEIVLTEGRRKSIEICWSDTHMGQGNQCIYVTDVTTPDGARVDLAVRSDMAHPEKKHRELFDQLGFFVESAHQATLARRPARRDAMHLDRTGNWHVVDGEQRWQLSASMERRIPVAVDDEKRAFGLLATNGRSSFVAAADAAVANAANRATEEEDKEPADPVALASTESHSGSQDGDVNGKGQGQGQAQAQAQGHDHDHDHDPVVVPQPADPPLKSSLRTGKLLNPFATI